MSLRMASVCVVVCSTLMIAWLVSSSWATSSFNSAVFSVRMERKLDNVSNPWILDKSEKRVYPKEEEEEVGVVW